MELPGKLLDSLSCVSGFDPVSFLRAHGEAPPVSIRFNPYKIVDRNTMAVLANKVPWSSGGFYLSERPVFTLDPALHAGAYYVQEASSMFLEYVLAELLPTQRDLKVLDLCAAPGGKTTLLASMPQFHLVVANEIIRTRVNILYENAVKWGDPKIIVSNNDPSVFARLEGFFDVMVVDAPCSGSGLFRKDPDALKEWSTGNVQLCSERQKRILADALPALKKDGILVYSTCSYSKEEDEDILDWLIELGGFEPIDLPVTKEWGIEKTSSTHGGIGFRFFPGKTEGEGLFMACLRKRSGNEDEPGDDYVMKQFPASYHKALEGWLKPGMPYALREQEKDIILLPLSIQKYFPILDRSLSLRKSGVRAGAMIRDVLIPDHELVLSYFLNNEAPTISLQTEDALRFLRKQEFLPGSTEKGWFVMRYKGLALGLIKHLGNRVNNYYPAAWRILMS